VGGDGPLAGGLPGGRGGRGMAGGGDGKEVCTALLRALELLELDRWRSSRGSMDMRVELRFASSSCDWMLLVSLNLGPKRDLPLGGQF